MILNNPQKLYKDDVTLTVVNKEHETILTSLAADKQIWEYAPEQYYHPEIFKEKWLKKAFKQMTAEERICFIVSCNNKIIGSSSFYEIDIPNKKTNIGYTWFHPSVWRTKINPLTKLIMLEYAFETLKLNRVGFSVDSMNIRSCRALEKCGVKREGILRNHLVLPDRIRHSVIFSVINNEWDMVKENLKKLIEIF